MDAIKLLESYQEELGIPDCFMLSETKLMNDDTLSNLIQAIACDMLNIGHQYAMLEIIKQWLIMKKMEEQSTIPDTDDEVTHERL